MSELFSCGPRRNYKTREKPVNVKQNQTGNDMQLSWNATFHAESAIVFLIRLACRIVFAPS